MAYNTGNPVGSTDPRDLFDNAGIVDQYVNGPNPFYPDRFGVQRLSLSGQRYNFDQSMTGWDAAFQAFLVSSGFEAPVSYAAGVTLERATQTFVRNNIQYRIKDPADLPYTLTGDWEMESGYFAVMGDSGLRQDLASGTGAGLVGYEDDADYPLGSVGEAIQKSGLGHAITSLQFDLVSLENGRSDPSLNSVAWELMRGKAIAEKAKVVVFPGTYILPPSTRIDASNTVWEFMPGCVLKLQDAQVTNENFLVAQSPVNQRTYGLTFDANRALQVSATFGIDRCGVIVVDPINSKYYDTHVISSPAKGFAVVGSGGGTVNSVVVDGITGGNCRYQAVLFDGNNMTSTWAGGNYLGRVNIGETSHAGVAINDGVHNLMVGSVYCDVNNTEWDAISIRDSWDIWCEKLVGKRGRNGVQAWSLNVLCERIDLGDAWGEGNLQSGVAITGARDIRGGSVGGRNNAFGGLNVGQRNVAGVLTTSKRISIANPIGFDDRVTPVQQYGLFVGGADDVTFGSRGTIYGNVTKNVSIVRAAPTTNVNYPKVERVSDQAFTVTAGGSVDVVCNFPVAFEDVQYDVEIETAVTSAGLTIWSANLRAKTATAVTVHVVAATGSAGSGTVSVKATRRP